ncbi:hypothetical protein SLE2022_180580 [Rubroshorea leprosula]
MSLEKEEQSTLDHDAETNKEFQRKLKFSYSRDFLLSLSELDVCQKLPTGFDPSLLSEFEDASQDRQRISGTLSLHGLRRNEYGSSPPTRGEFGNYSRGTHGRWDSRPSGRSDRDSDSQSDWDSDSGKRYGNQSRRSWQVPEHDGLLGSGSFPRPSGYAAGASAPKFRSNDHYQLNRSNEPYHPPRPYKAVPHTRRDTDSYNDETFGSSECTSEDRAEEERKRRASFELFRKQQQKEFQEKQKVNPERRKDDFDFSELLEDSKDEKGHLNGSKELDGPATSLAPENDSEKSSLPLQAHAARPLVPPGFTSTNMERNFGTKTAIHSDSLQVGSSELEGGHTYVKENHLLNGTSDILSEKQLKQHAEKSSLSEPQHGSLSVILANNRSEKTIPSSVFDVSNETVVGSQIYKSSNLSEVFQAAENSEVIELGPKKLPVSDIMGESNQHHSTSILDKIFGSALTLNGSGSTSSTEHQNNKADDAWPPGAVHSSKFARWFLEEERKPVEDLSSGRPNDLLSLIKGGERGGAQVSDVAIKNVPPNLPFQSPEPSNRHVRSSSTSGMENSEQLCNVNNVNKPAAAPAVLTCEDLEKSILSESSEKDSTLNPPVQGWSIPNEKTQQQKVDIDNQASQHLLSLLQKGTGMTGMDPPSNLDIVSLEKVQSREVASIDSAHDSIEVSAKNASSSGRNLTLEALFGSAFMQELQSVGAPASFQRDSTVSARVDSIESNGLPLSVKDSGLLSSAIHTGLNSSDYETNIFTQRERMKSDGIGEHVLGFDDHRTVPDSSQHRAELGSKLGAFDGSASIRLPEEDTLIAVSDPVNLQNFMPVRNSVKAELLPLQETPVDIVEKLAALKPAVGGQDGLFLRGLYDMREPDIPFQNLNVQSSSSQLHPRQLNHAGPFSHPPNMNPQMHKFMSQEAIIHQDPPPHHQFPANMLRPPFHHPSSGLTGFDPPLHPMLQQMAPGNFPPHLQRGFPGSAPMPHSNNPVTGFMQEMNPMQGFPFDRRQPNFPGLGMPPGPDVSSTGNQPEALQRLIEMELRTNSKQIHPFGGGGGGGGGHSQGMYGHELDTGFGYR